MLQNLIVAGVGGQGILTIAQAISNAALRRGLNVKQAEVHGMAQRGGGVESHLRISDEPIYSDLIPLGEADLVISVEPLESLRFVHYLRERGAVVSSVNAFINIGNYPAIEDVLQRIASYPQHVLLDTERLAKAAGSVRAANVVALGAASIHIDLAPELLERVVSDMFAHKGEKVVEVNRRAFRFGRNAARAYADGIARGASSAAVRQWLGSVDANTFAEADLMQAPDFDIGTVENQLSWAEYHAVERTLEAAFEEGRTQLYEHEVYSLIRLVGAISPPHHLFLTPDVTISDEALAKFPGQKVVLKVVSPQIVHKTEAGAVVFVRKDLDAVQEAIERLFVVHRESDVRGVLVVEFVEPDKTGFGGELFVGIRATREFGPVVAAGVGGVNTEFFASRMKPGEAVAKAIATDTTAEEFMELFKRTAAYDVLSGQARGHERITSDGELLRCFRAFISLAQRFCVDRGAEGPDVAELEVNPFGFRNQKLVPLDGRARLAPVAKGRPPRPLDKVERLLEPRTIGVLGVSSKSMNFGRIILNNVLGARFDRDRLVVIKPDEDTIDGVRCVPSLADAPEYIDLLVVAAGAAQLPAIVNEIVDSEKVASVVLIPGGVGETEGSEEIMREVREAIARGRARADGGPVFLGPNSLGVVSRPGHYDTFFIPTHKLDKRWDAPPRPVALLSQSGAFIITRLSQMETMDPAFAVSIGNQLDLTPSDFLKVIGTRTDVHTVGIYSEGFNNADGLELLRALAISVEAGKDVVFYKAGRTEQGRDAAAGHTAAVAGDYDICQSAADQAGALVADTFTEFANLLEISTALHGKQVGGLRVGAISNAGFETVGMADAVRGERYAIEMATLPEAATQEMTSMLQGQRLGSLVNPRNPLDLTPMATEEAYEQAVRIMLASDQVDAVVVGIVPLTAALKTTEAELAEPGTLAVRLPQLFAETDKPLVVVVDSGGTYDALVRALRDGGIPVFRSADQAMRALGRYLTHRTRTTRRA